MKGTRLQHSKSKFSLMMTLMLSWLLILAAQSDLFGQAQAAYVDLDAVQLDQLVAPIALDPDSLVAQILTASTYPDQVAAADTWLNQNMNLPPDQRAAGANAMNWDPAVKGLIEFPSTLDNLAKNTAWASQLGNAYYNQPGDVMNAVQAMRLQAQDSKVLVTTTQQRVVVEAGLIEIVPVNPAVVFVPYYNPWTVWGTLFVAYPGFVVLPPPPGIVWGAGLAFDPGIAVGVYAGFGWGFGAWAPAWDGGTVLFGGNTYISNSMTVCNHGYFGGHDRGVFEHGGRGVPGGYHAHAHPGAARAAAGRANANRGRMGAGHSAFGGSKPSAGRSAAANHSAASSHSAAANHSASASRGASSANRGGSMANRGASSANRGSSMANRGASSANRGGASANRGASSANRGSSMASRGASSANRGSSMASRGASSANRGSSMASRGASSGNRGGASANRGASSANRGSSASRGASSANRGGASANRGASSGNRGGSMASRGGASAGRSASAGHSGGGGRSSGGRGRGK